MPFVCLAVDDDAMLIGARGYIERNSIAILSNYDKAPRWTRLRVLGSAVILVVSEFVSRVVE